MSEKIIIQFFSISDNNDQLSHQASGHPAQFHQASGQRKSMSEWLDVGGVVAGVTAGVAVEPKLKS